jgi:AcrR family transcriptional regulator
MSDQPVNPVEEKIISAAVECLERYGIEGTTNRVIASTAGINSAAINYYFRNKEVLIQKVMERTMDNAFDWKDLAELPGNTPVERCVGIFNHLIEGGLNYPGITRAHFHDLLTSGKYDSLVVKRLNQFALQLCDDLLSRGYNKPRAELEMSCMQILNAVFMTVLVPQLYQKSFGLDLADPATRSRFVQSLVEKLL